MNICITKEGRELVQGTPGNLRQYTQQNILRIGFSEREKAKDCAQILTEIRMLPLMSIRENSIFVDISDGRKVFENVNKWLLEKNISFEAIEIVNPSLEDVFLKLTTGAERS